jgi:hypothetical protein
MIDPNYVIETQLKSQLSTDVVCIGNQVIPFLADAKNNRAVFFHGILSAVQFLKINLLITNPIF